MRTIAVLLGLIAVASAPLLCQDAPASAQNIQEQPVRDAAALDIIRGALSALQAGNTIPSDWIIQGTSQTSGSQRPPTTFVWKGSGEEFRVELQRSSYSRVFASGHGNPATVENGRTSAVAYHVARAHQAFYLPALVLWAELNNPKLTITTAAPSTINGTSALHVHVSDDTDEVGSWVTPHEWYFDAVTGVPLRVEYRLPATWNAKEFTNISTEFSDYRAISGILVPFHLAINVDGVPLQATVSSVVFNAGVAESEFDLSNGGGQ